MDTKEKETLTFEALSERFKVGMRTLFRWQNRLEPKRTRNKPATKIDMNALQSDIEKNPDHYLSERAERFQVSVTGIFYAIQRLKMSYKKNSVSPKSRSRRSNKVSNKNKTS